MKQGDWEATESYHCVNCAGTLVLVTTEVRKEIEAWLRTLEYPKDYFAQLTVDTILGEEITIIADSVNIIYETTPEIRYKNRELDKMMRDERLEQGFSNDE